ncbi:MAG TPA: fatty acid desaturase, partial [Tepidisphaeraceae bacterium]|nr:fatty acid desaturase [Tepidisphaeraceae bacterium]
MRDVANISPLPLPTLEQLGTDLLRVRPVRRAFSLLIPFACIAAYVWLAWLRIWPLAVLVLMYLSFATYGSISHDLVHRNLGLSRRWNESLLTVIELLAFRSGHAYRLAHLHHHARFPHEDDIEGAAAKMSLPRTLIEGMIFQPRIMLWAIRHHGRRHPIVIAECAAALLLFALCIASIRITPVFATYSGLMIAGSWVIPLVTAHVPHDAKGASRLFQTRLFRGKVASIIAMQHLYHLEHHL